MQTAAERDCALASPSTLSRFENAAGRDWAWNIHEVLVEDFIASHSEAPEELMAGRYAHAKQFKRMNRRIKFLRTRLGRLIRDIERKIDGDEGLQETFAVALGRAAQIRGQKQRQRGWKLYSWHAPETECIGKGKARAPYEFGVKVSLTTTNRRCNSSPAAPVHTQPQPQIRQPSPS